MAPKQPMESSTILDDGHDDIAAKVPEQNEPEQVRVKYVRKIVWRNVFIFTYIHLAALYGVVLMFTSARIYTTIWAWFLYYIGGLGITAGAHRLWAHRSYKAKWPLRVLLALFNTVAFQNDIFEWSRDHRLHHKYSDTDADPHNSSRGFFFSHVGWLLVRKHPMVMEKGKGLDMSDLKADPVVMFQRKYYMILMPLVAFVIPTMIPVFYWGETWTNAWIVSSMFRFCFTLNMTWLVNSAAHMWGYKPFDASINPGENKWVAWGALGEGWHNYHHVFPWDYKTSELGKYSGNATTAFIDFFAKIGLAYDRKTVAKETIIKRVKRTGDGTHREGLHHHESNVWGWYDSDVPAEHREQTLILNGKKQS